MQFDKLLQEIEVELLQEENLQTKRPFTSYYDVFIPDYPMKNNFAITKNKQVEEDDPMFKIRIDKSFLNKTTYEQKETLKQILLQTFSQF